MIEKLSPAMAQYLQIKEKYKDCILFYRMGDFYEMFYEDALTVSSELDLVLTGKSCGTQERAPMCGVPYHSAETYISKLLANGHKVAICEQLTTPQKGVKMLERDVVQVITPGTIVDESMLEAQRNNYLLSVYKNGNVIGASYVDISTGVFEVVEINENFESELSNLLARIMPSEVIGNSEAEKIYNNLPQVRIGNVTKLTPYYEWAYSKGRANDNLVKQFGENYENVYDLKGKNAIICSAGALFEYINETQKRTLQNINKISLVKNKSFMTIDLNTRRNLEISENNRDRKKYGTILWVLDKTKTPMGARLMRKMVDEPLQDPKAINMRLNAVSQLVKKLIVRDRISELLKKVKDIERHGGRIAYGNIMPNELVTLKVSLQQIPLIKQELSQIDDPYLNECRESLHDVNNVVELIDKSITDDNEIINMKEGNFIKVGFNKELDEYRNAKTLGKVWIEELQKKESEETGIKNLKIARNKVFGYYIEVNRTQIDKVPLRYVRKQTIANNERYITEDLKEIEEKIVGSEEKAKQLESDIYSEIKNILSRYVQTFQDISRAVAKIDVILSLAEVAVKNNFVKPTINSNIKELKIIDGRHPVVEQFMNKGEFVVNDTFLDDGDNKIMIITGPNMAGKSTYMRQVAIITLLAHIGSFVPAKEAQIPITDRIFTRVGASDDLAFGQSTFMVEMSEVANILANATDKSLIVLDEIGRGTSTFDGLAIAWSVVEYLSKNFKSKTLFATHYHELTELEGVIPGVKNYKISVKELDDDVVFLRKIVRGGASRSFGIEVAKLAGVPKLVLDRAKEISKNLEKVNKKLDLDIFKENKERAEDNTKTALTILSILKDIDINRVSPMHAFDLLNDLVTRAKEENHED
mgnify:FL=1